MIYRFLFKNKSEVIFLHETVQYQPDCNLLQCLENSPVSFLTEKSAKMAGRLIGHNKCLAKEEYLLSIFKSLLSVNRGGQLLTTQPLAHLPPPQKRKRRINARKLGGQDKTNKQAKV